MTLTLIMPSCQQNNTLVSKIRLIATNLNPNNFNVIIDKPDVFDIENILIDNELVHLEISIICSSGSVEMLHQEYDENNCLFDVGYTEVTNIMQVLQPLFPDFIWDKVADSVSDYVQESTTETLEIFTLQAIAQLL